MDDDDTTGAARQDGARLVRRVTVRAVLAAVLGNTVSTVVVVTLLAVVLPIPDDARLIEPLTLVLTPVYAVLAVVVGVTLGVRSTNRRLAWLADGRSPTEEERIGTLSIPWTVAKLQASLWIVAALLFAATQVTDDVLLAVEVGIAVLIGGLASSAWTHLAVEVTHRPVVAAAMQDAPVRPARGTGITWRAVMAWLLGTGLPLAGLIALASLAVPTDIERGELALSAAVLGGVAFVTGIEVTLLAARSVAHPLRTLRRAVERLTGGERDVTVAVTDGGEIGVLQTAFNQLAAGLAERDQLRDLFGLHVGEQVARQALDEGVELGGEARDVTVLFVDVAGSTTLAERTDPHEVIDRLNHLFGVVVRHVESEDGTVTTFAGDAAVCAWGAPTHHPRPATAALRAARRLASELADDPEALPVGIGVARGSVVAGNIGSRDRLAYTVIGDAVNTAARLSDLAKQRDTTVLADRRLVAAAGDESEHWRPVGEQVLRGRNEPTSLATTTDVQRSPGPQETTTMTTTSTRDHWEQRWHDHDHDEMGWFQSEPQPSLELVTTHTPAGGRVLDVGGGASLLVDHLLEHGLRPVVLDLAEGALATARERLATRADEVEWVRGDVTEVRLDDDVDTWHDRAVLHFLLEDDDRAAYVATLRHHLRPGGHAVIGTFAPDGPTTCSGLPVRRHAPADVLALLGDGFTLVEDRAVTHVKPSGDEQAFAFVVARRDA